MRVQKPIENVTTLLPPAFCLLPYDVATLLPSVDMVSEQKTEISVVQRSRIISKFLSPAVRLWLRSQVDSAAVLQFEIEGGDRQILSGHIAKVTIAAQGVVYQGISLSQISAVGRGIRVNLGEVLRGKPLQLINVVPVQAEARLTESDLNASVQTPLLANALADLLKDWLRLALLDELPEPFDRILPDQLPDQSPDQLTDQLPDSQNKSVELHPTQIQLRNDQLVFGGALVAAGQQSIPFTICTGLQVIKGTKLRLDRPQWLAHLPATQGQPLPHLHGYEIDLGSEVNIQHLVLQAGQVICRGSINVLP